MRSEPVPLFVSAIRVAFLIPIHLRTFLFLAPFGVMLLIQQLLNIDDNLMVLPRPGTRDGQSYNLVMAFIFWTGVIGFTVHTAIHANTASRWVAIKLLFLAAVFAACFYPY